MIIERGRNMIIDYSQIGRRIAERRKKLGLKQSQVEESAGLSYKYLSNIERGISIPSTEVIMRIALALDTTPDTFLTGTTKLKNEEWRNVAQRLRNLSTKQLKLINALIDAVISQDEE